MTAPEGLSVAGAEWFSWPETKAAFACLNREGFEARAVGGAVRNAILGWGEIAEVDFATTAPPEETLKLAGAAGVKALPTGLSHGTVTLVIGGKPFEVTTLREDVETHGRRATVAFGNDWAGDARRRDFTMNALYADAEGRVHDPLGGLPDLRAGRVRFIGGPRERIREDYLRILRFFRFSAGYARGAFDTQGIAACIGERAGLGRLSRERIRTELLRILVAGRAADAIEIMQDSGLLALILGGVTRLARFNRVCEIQAALDEPPDAIARLAALAVFIREDAERLTERLRLSSQEAKDLTGLSEIRADFTGEACEHALKATLYRLGPKLYLRRLLLAWADSGATPGDTGWHAAASLAREWERPVFPVTGADLISHGVKPGPAMGALLKALEDRWIASGFTSSREALLTPPERSNTESG